MNKSESSAVPEPQESAASADLIQSPLDAPSPDVKSLVQAEAEAPAVSLQATTAQRLVAATHPVGDLLEHPAEATMAPPVRPRHQYPHIPHPRLRPVHMPTVVRTFDSFRHTNYRFLWASTFFFSAGYWLQMIIVGWLTYQLTQSALLTSVVMGLDALPILLAGPLGGVIVDAWDKRKLMTVVLIYQSLLSLAFGVSVLAGVTQVWHIFAFVFLMGLSWIITDPARMALIPSMVPRQSLVNAFALNSLAFSVTRLAAPAIGGAILAIAGAGPALLVEAVLLAAAGAVILGLRLEPKSKSKMNIRSAIDDVMEGVRYIRSEKLVLTLLLFGLVPSVMVMPFFHGLIPVYAAEVFNVGPVTLGLLMASAGAGSVMGTLALASLGDMRRKGRVILGCVALASLAMVAMAFNPSLSLAYPILMVGSIGLMGYYSTAQATIQSILPDKIRGRVSGIYIMTFGLMPVGSLAAGLIAESMGAPTATFLSAIAVAVLTIIMATGFRELWRLK